jgi:hypothetical protein
MTYAKLRCVNFPATVTNKVSHVSNGLVDDLIKKDERGETCFLRLFHIQKKLYVLQVWTNGGKTNS